MSVKSDNRLEKNPAGDKENIAHLHAAWLALRATALVK